MSARPLQVLPLPVWVRMPGPGEKEHFSGLKQGKLYHLCVPGPANRSKPPVRSILVDEDAVESSVSQNEPAQAKRKGRSPIKKRAVRLIRLSSLLAYLDGLEAKQHPQLPAAA